jgi:hypothetical protein
MSQTLRVDYDEIMNRAAELETEIPGRPTQIPLPPCQLAAAKVAAQQLAANADNMQKYLDAEYQELQNLAQSMRNAAKSYGTTDTTAQDAVEAGHAVLPEAPGDDTEAPLPLGDTPTVPPAPASRLHCKQAARALAAGDQGRSLLTFADQWTAYKKALLDSHARFRGFDNWEGSSAEQIEESMKRQSTWLTYMGDMCDQLAEVARTVVADQQWAVSQHPTFEEISDAEYNATSGSDVNVRNQWRQRYMQYQELSDAVQLRYTQNVFVRPLTPDKPPAAVN